MLIKDTKVYILADEPKTRVASSYGRTIEPVAPGLTGRFTRCTMVHAEDPSKLIEYKSDTPLPTYKSMIRVITDGDLNAYTTFETGFDREELLWRAYWFKVTIAPKLIGVDALDREFVWERLWYGQRFNYSGKPIVETVDNMLWDLASRHARQPLFKLLGGTRERVPAYYDILGFTIDELVADAVKAKALGFKGAKDHSYRGVKANIELAKELRAAVGDDFMLMHDCVWNYTYDDAVKVGRELEKLNYSWMEEPLMDYDTLGLKKLSDTLDLPILGMEYVGALGGQPFSASAFLAMRAVDIVRQRGVGITGQMKVAQAAESFGIPIHGGIPQTILANAIDPAYESGPPDVKPPPDPATLTCAGIHVVQDGWMSIAYSDRPAPEPDWDELEKTALVVI